MKFTLTKKKPTKQGWYWCEGQLEPVYVVPARTGGWVFYVDHGIHYVNDYKRWSQRIPEPTTPAKETL